MGAMEDIPSVKLFDFSRGLFLLLQNSSSGICALPLQQEESLCLIGRSDNSS